MNHKYMNYYKMCRDHAGLTQEKAAELLGISIRSLSAYENWETSVPENAVLKMVRLYKMPLLGWWHFKNTSELGKECLPDIQMPQANSDTYMQACLAKEEILAIISSIQDLLYDLRITKEEMPQWNEMRNLARQAAGKLISISTYEPELSE